MTGLRKWARNGPLRAVSGRPWRALLCGAQRGEPPRRSRAARATRLRIEEARDLADARDRVVHGYIGLGLTKSGSRNVMTRHTRSKAEQELTEASLTELARRLGGWVMGSARNLVRLMLARDAVDATEVRALADWLRTNEVSE
jgi:hypothetical protein